MVETIAMIQTQKNSINHIALITYQSNLNHIKDISSKAHKQVGLLYRRFYKHASPATLRTLNTAVIHPYLECIVPVWDPHLCKDIDALESVQRFATKICTKSWNMKYQYTLNKLRLQTLNIRNYK